MEQPMTSKWQKLFLLAIISSTWVAACRGGQSGGAVPLPVDLPQSTLSTPSQRVGIGIAGLSYWDRSVAMADVGRQSQPRGVDWSYDVAADADGNPSRDFLLIFSSTKIGSGTYKLTFSGRATVSPGGAGSVQNVSYDAASNTTRADVVLTGDPSGNVWLTFKDTHRTNASIKGDGVTNIHLWRPGYATDGSTLFTTEFVSAIKKFKTIRGMDFVSANANPQSTWAERTKPNFFGLTGENGQSWELLIALANTAGRDVWLNLPVRANDDYIHKLAQLVKYGSDGTNPYTIPQSKPVYAPLKAGLKVYVEYGNEVWNSGPGFKGFGWSLALANANRNDATHPITVDGLQSDQYIALRRWIAFRSSVISLAFREVFGDAAMMTTVRPIFSTQVGDANNYLSNGLAWAQSFYGQVRQSLPVNAVVRKPSEIWYGGGGAAYYDASIDPKDTGATTMDTYFASLPTPAFARDSVIDSIWTHAYGLKYVAYEGGPGPGGSALGSAMGAAVAPAFNNNPRMKDRMLVAQDIWDQAGGDELVYYVYSSSAPWSFTNELVQQVVADTSSVKLQAIDAINAKPKPAVTLGSLVPGTIHLKNPASQTIGADTAMWALGGSTYLLRPSTGNSFVLVPIRTASAGTYRISLNIGAKVTGSLALFVNGTSNGVINLAPDASNTATVSSKVTVALPAGLSVLRLDTPQGSGDIFVRDVVVE
jgi:hypothetical protein